MILDLLLITSIVLWIMGKLKDNNEMRKLGKKIFWIDILITLIYAIILYIGE